MPRADAVRNREAVLDAADRLLAGSSRVSMDAVAAEAGVGKGTLFRRFADRADLIRAVHERRIETLRAAVEEGPPPLGPGGPPAERVLAVLDALLVFKLSNRPLMIALEQDVPSAGSLYESASYRWAYDLLAASLAQLDLATDPGWTAYALIAQTRADLVEHLAGQFTEEALREQLRAFARQLLTWTNEGQSCGHGASGPVHR